MCVRARAQVSVFYVVITYGTENVFFIRSEEFKW